MIEAQRGLSPRPITPLEIGIGNGNTSTLATLESEDTAHIMRISFVEKETTMTTDKNNPFHPGATAPGFKIAAQLRGEKEEVVFTCCFGCFQIHVGTVPSL